MSTSRRRFLLQSGVLVAASVAQGERAIAAPPSRTATRAVAQILPGIPAMDGAGVKLTRVIGQPALRNLDPFILLDRFHSEDADAYLRGFPDHPHRGFETVTVMMAGQMRHRDSHGNKGLIVGGGAQWMTAGRGIVHSEMPEQEKGLMSGFQLWVNLPASEKLCPQRYQDLQPAQLAEGSLNSASRVRVISGKVEGLTGPVRERPTAPLLLTAALEDDRPLEIATPPGHASFAFVGSGEVAFGDEGSATTVGHGNLAIFGPGTRVRLRATLQRSEVLLASARPIGEPIVQRGPFVMNTEAEIQQAWQDYRDGVLDQG